MDEFRAGFYASVDNHGCVGNNVVNYSPSDVWRNNSPRLQRVHSHHGPSESPDPITPGGGGSAGTGGGGGVGGGGGGGGGGRRAMDMGVGSMFQMSPMDIEPLFTLSSVTPNYNDLNMFKDFQIPTDRPIADALLSLKHVVVHPPPHPPPPPQSASSSNWYIPNLASNFSSPSPPYYPQTLSPIPFSYSPSQSRVSHHISLPPGGGNCPAPNGCSGGGISNMTSSHCASSVYDSPPSPPSSFHNHLPSSHISYHYRGQPHHSHPGNSSGGGGSYSPPPFYRGQGHTATIFPSMSVNVSMNMNVGVSPYGPPPGGMGRYGPASFHNQGPSGGDQWGVHFRQSPTNYPHASSYDAYARSNHFYPPPPSPYYSPSAPHHSGGHPSSFSASNNHDILMMDTSPAEESLRRRYSSLTPSVEYGGKGGSSSSTKFYPSSNSRWKGLSAQVRALCGVGGEGESDSHRHIHGGSNVLGTNGSLNGEKLNLCRICGKTYARPSTLKTHLRTHSGEKPYVCGTCMKSFSQAANLTAHVRTHSGEKPFNCPVCDRRFSQSSSVTTHMRTHSGERPYRCRMCKKTFSDSSTLTKHLRIHSGEKPYSCKVCLLRFSQSGNLNRHMRVHCNT